VFKPTYNRRPPLVSRARSSLENWSKASGVTADHRGTADTSAGASAMNLGTSLADAPPATANVVA